MNGCRKTQRPQTIKQITVIEQLKSLSIIQVHKDQIKPQTI